MHAVSAHEEIVGERRCGGMNSVTVLMSDAEYISKPSKATVLLVFVHQSVPIWALDRCVTEMVSRTFALQEVYLLSLNVI